jgi:glutamate dehydrogenase
VAELSKAIARLMEERERTQPHVVSTDPPPLRAVLEAARARLSPGERPLVEAFLRQLLDKGAVDLLVAVRAEELAALGIDACRFFLERSPQEPRIRVFDPDLAHHGWESPCTVVETVMRDRPFIIDTLRMGLRDAGCAIRRLLHPVMAVERDARANVLAINAPRGPGRKESLVHVEIDRVPDPEALAERLAARLNDVVLATDDYAAMRARAETIAEELRSRPLPPPWNADLDEVAAFLEWLGQKSFVFLGYREYQFAGAASARTAAVRRRTGLGILRREEQSSYATPRLLPEELRRRLNEPPLVIVSKTNVDSTIHRRAPMDYIGVKEIDGAGIVVGERRFLGLFTSKAYAEEPMAVPLLRRKLAAILEADGVVEDSHDYKAISTIFNSMPKVELLATPVPELRALITTVLAAEGGRDIKVLHRPDALARGLFVVVILPRERFSEDLYRRVEARLAQALAASAVLEQRLALDESDQVRLHFYFAAPPDAARTVPQEELRDHVLHLLRTWDDRLRDALRATRPRDEAEALADRYAAAFSEPYKAATEITVALRDIRCLEALLQTRSAQADVVSAAPGAEGEGPLTAIKLYLTGDRLVLSDFLPVLENLGLKVFAEDALDVALPQVGRVTVHTFIVQGAGGEPIDADAAAPLLTPALLLLRAGRIENDRLNALILGAGLEWRQVDLLRTYVNHAAQTAAAPSRGAAVTALVSYPLSARLLWEYCAAKFNPRLPVPPRDRLAEVLPVLEQRFLASLDTVDSLTNDQILRALFSAVAATVRTSYFQESAEENGGSTPNALAIKIDCARLPHLSRPLPVCEIYVHAPHVEALHLRGATVARGGIRLSDRPDDFRAEILDLMATQTVKNAVIIPAGAKGGFVTKHRAGTAVTAGQIMAAYRTFIGALLDLTDNLVDGRVVPPPLLLAYDEPDPYLVVAADKGTATFSDLANEIAVQRGFWLADAFASGGSHGYDHKKEGITARGAWECVQRHFREMGRDASRDSISVVGIGDMSGDVFGNGLLLSRRFRLQAAFNHQHIFLDPDPDPARAFSERERLFHLPRSSWSEYNPLVLSEGGGVFPRHAKKIPLSPPVRQMLGLDVESGSGDEVVRAILCMEADLLWSGGIGTYVKASDETHAEIGDSSNDAVRVNGADLRVRVVAEGGNLGLTQRGRVEYALRGGRINTDAIDNSGGVDLSDHEVNLKIALAPALESGTLSLAGRNQILADLTSEVTRRVLAHNQRQARALSLDQVRSQTHLGDFRELISQLQAEAQLDPRHEALPDRDALRNRRAVFLGLTRPELAVLLAHSKLALQKQLLASSLPDDPFFERHLRAYFPDLINAQFGAIVRSHRLRREIIAVETANELIDMMGASFVARVVRDTGADSLSVVRAWEIAVAASGAADRFAEISEADPPLPLQAEMRSWLALRAALEPAVKWIVATQPRELVPGKSSARLQEATEELLGRLPDILPPGAQRAQAGIADALLVEGTPRALAQRIAALDRLAELFEVAHIADEDEVPRAMAGEVYYRVSEIVDVDWIAHHLAELPAEGRWERRAVEGLREALAYARRQVTRHVLACHEGSGRVEACLEEYAGAHREQLDTLQALINDIKSGQRPTLAALLVVVRELGRLVGRDA